MIRKITMWAVTALLVVAVAAPVAFAASPAEEQCDLLGGTYTGTGNPKTCVLPPEDTNPGNPQSDNAATPKHEQTTNTQTGAGGGGGEDRDSMTCVYNNGGKLQERNSDPGCPPTQ
jgi:hypothetical protein